jgi:hypothetical protein
MRNGNTSILKVVAGAVLAACAGADGPSVQTPVTVAASGASNPTVAIDRDGRSWVAWAEADGPSANVWVARSDDGLNFDVPVRANDIEGDAAPHEQAPAQVDVGPEGNVYVLWQNNTPVQGRMYPYSNLRLARSTDGGRSFEPAIFVNDDADGPPASHTFHDLAVAPDGTVWVSWIDSRARAAQERELAGAAGQHGRDPAADTAAAAHAGHGDASLPGPEIRIARSTDGGLTFGPSTVVAWNACPCCRTALAIARDGTVHLSWRTVLAGNIRDVVVAHSTDSGTSFSSAERVHDDDWEFEACPHAGSSLAIDAEGRLHVAWYTGAAPRPGIRTATSTDSGQTFRDARDVLVGEWVPPSQVKLAAAGEGRIAMAWDDRRSGEPRLSIAWLDAATGRLEVNATFAGASPAIASADGVTAVAWLDGDAVRFTQIPATRDANHPD